LEVVDHVPAVCDVGCSIKTEEGVLSEVHEVLEDVNHLGHLAEDEHLIAVLLFLLQDSVQLSQFR
jgi:hypothetical protein